jgi:hypothetical protein
LAIAAAIDALIRVLLTGFAGSKAAKGAPIRISRVAIAPPEHRHLRELGSDVCGGEPVLEAGEPAGSTGDTGSRLAATMRAATPSPAQIRIFATVELVMPGKPCAFPANGTAELLRRGKSSIKRPAIAFISASSHAPEGSRAIDVANLCVARFFGSSDNSAASFQGSRFSRANADRTLSGVSSLSTPIGA